MLEETKASDLRVPRKGIPTFLDEAACYIADTSGIKELEFSPSELFQIMVPDPNACFYLAESALLVSFATYRKYFHVLLKALAPYKERNFKELNEQEREEVYLSSKLALLLSGEFNTVFAYRFRLLEGNLISSLEEELHFLGLLALHNKKSSIIWYYRRKVIALLLERGSKSLPDVYKTEMAVVQKAVAKFPRGYYIWIHRQTIVQLLSESWKDVLELERKAITSFCEVNVHNYSAFSYKLWVVSQISAKEATSARSVISEEQTWIDNLLQTYTQLYKGDDRPEMTRLESLNKYTALLKKMQSKS